MSYHKCLLLPVLWQTFLLVAYGQDKSKSPPDTTLLFNEILITSTRQPTSQKNLPYSITLLSQKDLVFLQNRTTPEALSGVNGLFVQKTNHGGGSAFIRGLTGNQTLTMIDGIRLNNPTFRYGPNQYLNTIDPYNISKIELLRGSGSVQYGSDALGGVIQIFTKDPQFSDQAKLNTRWLGKAMTKDMEYTGRAEVEYQSRELAVLMGGTRRKFGDLVGGNTTGIQTPSGYKEQSFDGKLNWKMSDQLNLIVAHQLTRQDQVPLYHRIRLENFEYYFFDPQIRQLSYVKLERHHQSRWLKKLSMISSFQKSREARNFYRKNDKYRFEESDRVNTTGQVIDILSVMSEIWSFNSGVEYYYSKVRSSRTQINIQDLKKTRIRGLYPEDAATHNSSLYSLHHLNLGHFKIEGGLRYNFFKHKIPNEDPFLAEGENIIVKPSSLVSNIGVLYQIGSGHSIFTSYNTGYRAPNIDDLGTLGLVDFRFEIPAYDLNPEKSKSGELGYRFIGRRLLLYVNFFYMHLNNLIIRKRLDDQMVNGYHVYIKENSQQSFIRGVDFSLDYRISAHWRFRSSLSSAHGHNLSDQEPMRRIPPLHGAHQLSYEKSTWGITGEHLYAALQDRLAAGDINDNRIPIGGTPGWNIINIYGFYQIKQLTIRSGIQNLSNQDYRTHGSGINGIGRSAWVAMQLDW